MVQINDVYYEDLNETNFIDILKKLKNKKEVKSGSQIGRRNSEPLRKK